MTYTEIIDNIQTRTENLISERFTGTYFNIKIEPSNYNPDIDDTITVTITVTDQNDDPIPNWTVPLTINGTAITGTLTTNANGVATYNYTCSEWGVCRFSVKTFSAFVNVAGWKTVQTGSKFTAKSNGRAVSVKCSQESNSGTVGTEYDIGTLISGYRPQYPITVPLESIGSDGGNYGHIRCYTNGEIKLKISRSTYSSSGGLTLYGTVEFAI